MNSPIGLVLMILAVVGIAWRVAGYRPTDYGPVLVFSVALIIAAALTIAGVAR